MTSLRAPLLSSLLGLALLGTGGLAAAEVIQHYGARPEMSLAKLLADSKA